MNLTVFIFFSFIALFSQKKLFPENGDGPFRGRRENKLNIPFQSVPLQILPDYVDLSQKQEIKDKFYETSSNIMIAYPVILPFENSRNYLKEK